MLGSCTLKTPQYLHFQLSQEALHMLGKSLVMAQWALQQGKWVWSGKNAFSFFPAQHAMHAKGFPLTPLAFPLLCPQTAVGSKTSYELIEMKQSLCIAGGLRMLFANNMTFWAETEKLFLFLTTSHLLRTYPIMVLQETSSLFCPAADCYGFMVQKLRDQYCISSYSLENRRNRKSPPPPKCYMHMVIKLSSSLKFAARTQYVCLFGKLVKIAPWKCFFECLPFSTVKLQNGNTTALLNVLFVLGVFPGIND